MKKVRTHVVVDDSIIDQNDVWEVVDPIWYSANIYGGQSEYENSIAGFSQEQRWLLAICWYQAEVYNGGHDQFYWNSTGIVWRDALSGLRAIGFDEVAEILAESANRLGGEPSPDRSERQKALRLLAPDFDDLDRRFFAVVTVERMNDELMVLIRDNRDRFYFDGYVEK